MTKTLKIKPSLLAKINSLDPDAFSEAYDMYSEKIYKYFYFRTSSQELTEDLTSQTFLKAWDYLRRDNNIDHFASFIYRIAHNLLVDHYRKKKEIHDDELMARMPDTKQGKDIINEMIDRDISKKELLSKIDELNHDDKEILMYRYVDDMDFKEISKITGKTPDALYVKLHRAVKRLKIIYEN
ncbi:sigma-70 family RNA polymerase sigma factor [bacterium]|jgi:RNA polymerase sigma-70 factor, ECF subfamily|nr:sigma-70 family RNA polymerase sigma factor [bacterium]MBT4122189.1 sigma-70 family RNA polymerase sigma factor [bacterium]MBT4335726.1 sigma-70 family RNA polymerase sigma factor [bacterium]MBT4495790.1 sigma-70 family RNA polymerase sigma factor [bacterium]MBT4763818.1 sigma-70 family RNA polymerase sigma factor [bacterium]